MAEESTTPSSDPVIPTPKSGGGSSVLKMAGSVISGMATNALRGGAQEVFGSGVISGALSGGQNNGGYSSSIGSILSAVTGNILNSQNYEMQTPKQIKTESVIVAINQMNQQMGSSFGILNKNISEGVKQASLSNQNLNKLVSVSSSIVNSVDKSNQLLETMSDYFDKMDYNKTAAGGSPTAGNDNSKPMQVKKDELSPLLSELSKLGPTLLAGMTGGLAAAATTAAAGIGTALSGIGGAIVAALPAAIAAAAGYALYKTVAPTALNVGENELERQKKYGQKHYTDSDLRKAQGIGSGTREQITQQQEQIKIENTKGNGDINLSGKQINIKSDIIKFEAGTILFSMLGGQVGGAGGGGGQSPGVGGGQGGGQSPGGVRVRNGGGTPHTIDATPQLNNLPGDTSWGDYGVRANNPGNMNYASWQGAASKFNYTDPHTGGAHTMAVFKTMEDGVAGAYKLMLRNQEKYGKTIAGALHGWAENSYIGSLAKSMGVGQNDSFDISKEDPNKIAKLMQQQFAHEGRHGSHSASMEQILGGVKIGRGGEGPQGEHPAYQAGDPNSNSKSMGSFSDGAQVSKKSNLVSIADKYNGMNYSQVKQNINSKLTYGEWCADFVNGVIKESGGKGSGTSKALDLAKVGTKVEKDNIKAGDILTENHGGGHGHAMIATDEHDKRGFIKVISGNYGNKVKYNWEDPRKIYAARRLEQPQQAAGVVPQQVAKRYYGSTPRQNVTLPHVKHNNSLPTFARPNTWAAPVDGPKLLTGNDLMEELNGGTDAHPISGKMADGGYLESPDAYKKPDIARQTQQTHSAQINAKEHQALKNSVPSFVKNDTHIHHEDKKHNKTPDAEKPTSARVPHCFAEYYC